MFEQKDLLTWWTVNGLKVNVINLALPSVHGGSLEIMLTVPLQELLIFLNIHNTQIFRLGTHQNSKSSVLNPHERCYKVRKHPCTFCMQIRNLNALFWKIFLSEYNSYFLLAISLYELLKNEKEFLLRKRIPSALSSLFCASSKLDKRLYQ